MSETYLNDIDTDKVNTLLQDTDNNVSYFTDISESVVTSYTNEIDGIMNEIKDNIVNVDNPRIEDIEHYFAKLSNTIYFMGEKLEKVGIYDDMSKAAMKEVYNNAYLENQNNFTGAKKPTVAENQAVAEASSIYETSVNSIYARSYRIIKFKIESAQTMISTLSKMLSRRMSDNNVVNVAGRQILNEGM